MSVNLFTGTDKATGERVLREEEIVNTSVVAPAQPVSKPEVKAQAEPEKKSEEANGNTRKRGKRGSSKPRN